MQGVKPSIFSKPHPKGTKMPQVRLKSRIHYRRNYFQPVFKNLELFLPILSSNNILSVILLNQKLTISLVRVLKISQ